MLICHNSENRICIRLISLITLQVFLFTTSGYPQPSERSLFKNKRPNYEAIQQQREAALENKKEALSGKKQIKGSLAKQDPSHSVNISSLKDLSSIYIPEKLGRVTEVYQASGGKGREIVHIQDLHTNPEAQFNEAGILELLIKDYNLTLVCSEGAEGVVDTSSVSSFPDAEVREKTARLFVNSGELTAEEFVSITKYPDLPIWGIEDKDIYFQNIIGFNKIMRFSPDAQVLINQVKKVLDESRPRIYSGKLMEIDSKKAGYDEGILETNDYLEYLFGLLSGRPGLGQGPGADRYKNITILRESLDFERTINQDKIADESRGLLSALQVALRNKDARSEMDMLMAKAALFKNQKIAPFAFYSYLDELARRYLKDDHGRHRYFFDFVQYLKKVNSLDSAMFFNEIEELTYEIKDLFSTNENQKLLTKSLRHVKLLKDLFSLKLSNEELDYYLADKDSFTAGWFKSGLTKLMDSTNQTNLTAGIDFNPNLIDIHLPELEHFYEIAHKRDIAMVTNTLNEIERRNAEVTALVTGGFHTPGITKLLKEKGYSYVVISPYSTTGIDEENYRFLLSGKRRPISELIGQLKEGGKEKLRPIMSFSSDEFKGSFDTLKLKNACKQVNDILVKRGAFQRVINTILKEQIQSSGYKGEPSTRLLELLKGVAGIVKKASGHEFNTGIYVGSGFGISDITPYTGRFVTIDMNDLFGGIDDISPSRVMQRIVDNLLHKMIYGMVPAKNMQGFIDYAIELIILGVDLDSLRIVEDKVVDSLRMTTIEFRIGDKIFTHTHFRYHIKKEFDKTNDGDNALQDYLAGLTSVKGNTIFLSKAGALDRGAIPYDLTGCFYARVNNPNSRFFGLPILPKGTVIVSDNPEEINYIKGSGRGEPKDLKVTVIEEIQDLENRLIGKSTLSYGYANSLQRFLHILELPAEESKTSFPTNKGWISSPEYPDWLSKTRGKIRELVRSEKDLTVYYYAIGGGLVKQGTGGAEDIDIASPLLATDFTLLIGSDYARGDFKIFKRKVEKDLASLGIKEDEISIKELKIENYPVFTVEFTYGNKPRKVKVYYDMDAIATYPVELEYGYHVLYSRGNPGLIRKMKDAVKSKLVERLIENSSFIVMENLVNSDLGFEGFDRIDLGDTSWAGIRKLDVYTNIAGDNIDQRQKTLASNQGLTAEKAYGNLSALSQNLWFEWNYKARGLFKMIDPGIWASKEVDENPGVFLQHLRARDLTRLVQDAEFTQLYKEVMGLFSSYMDPGKEDWISRYYPELEDKLIAYLSLEFGVGKSTQNLQAGGLGALSGDHIKEMSDKGANFIGIGLMYKNGYLIQRIDKDGKQIAEYSDKDFSRMPKKEVAIVGIPIYDRIIYAKCWEVQVGRARLLLMDTDTPQNKEEWIRDITKNVYSGDKLVDFHQTCLLGIGAPILLNKLGLKPDFYHLNESHAAFTVVGLTKNLMDEQGLSFEEALVAVFFKTLFTIHTPIAAGNWRFDSRELRHAFFHYLKDHDLNIERIISLGEKDGEFNMAQLLVNLVRLRNGVSEEHGVVSREQWSGYAIGGILNGISIPYWQSPEMQELIKVKMDMVRKENPDLIEEILLSEAISLITDKELWGVHRVCKQRLVQLVRKSVKEQRIRNKDSQERIKESDNLFDENALTIAVARRFADYKRSDWVLSGDFERIRNILRQARDSGRPVQIIFAGKAHPKDTGDGQEIIRRIHGYIAQLEHEGVKGQVVFLEDYNLDMAHYLVQGADIWLSYPEARPIPKEASATSGEKAAANALINAGLPTGFMRKALVHRKNAFLFNNIYDFYNDLEDFIIDEYYENNDMPSREWLSIMRESLKTAMQHFGTDRMIEDYVDRYYMNGVRRSIEIEKDNYKLAKDIVSLIRQPEELLDKVKFSLVKESAQGQERVLRPDGTIEPIVVRASVEFGAVPIETIETSIIFRLEDRPERAIEMHPVQLLDKQKGIWQYEGLIEPLLGDFKSGSRVFEIDKEIICRFQIRVRPVMNFRDISNWPEKRSKEVGLRILPAAAGLASNTSLEAYRKPDVLEEKLLSIPLTIQTSL